MFDQFKAMGAIAGLLKDKDRLRAIADEFKAKLEQMRIEGQAGGGAVRITVDGQMKVRDVFLDPALIEGLKVEEAGGREMAQALIQEATNDAIVRAQAVVQDEARRLAEELGLPEMPGMPSLLSS